MGDLMDDQSLIGDGKTVIEMISDQVPKLIGDQLGRPSNAHGKTGPSSLSKVTISSHFIAIHSWSVPCSQRLQKSINPLILGVQGLSKSSMFIWLKSSSVVLVLIGSMPIPICNRFHERPANDFYGGTDLWRFHAQVSLNVENRDLDSRNLHSVLKISYAAYSCLFLLIAAQFPLEMCFAAQNRPKNHKNLYFGVQGHPRSSISVLIKSSVWLPISD